MHEFNPFSINKPKFLDILGFSDFNLDKERKILELKFNASAEITHSNDTIVQGGFVTAMLDSCMAQLVLALKNGQVNPLTLDINVQFLRPCTVGEITVKAKYIKDGKTIAYTSAELFQNDKIVASATATSKFVSTCSSMMLQDTMKVMLKIVISRFTIEIMDPLMAFQSY